MRLDQLRCSTITEAVSRRLSARRPWEKKARLMAFEKNILTQREETAGGWRKLHNEKQSVSSYSTDVTRVMNSRRMRWDVYDRDDRDDRRMPVTERVTRSHGTATGRSWLRCENNIRIKHNWGYVLSSCNVGWGSVALFLDLIERLSASLTVLHMLSASMNFQLKYNKSPLPAHCMLYAPSIPNFLTLSPTYWRATKY